MIDPPICSCCHQPVRVIYLETERYTYVMEMIWDPERGCWRRYAITNELLEVAYFARHRSCEEVILRAALPLRQTERFAHGRDRPCAELYPSKEALMEALL